MPVHFLRNPLLCSVSHTATTLLCALPVLRATFVAPVRNIAFLHSPFNRFPSSLTPMATMKAAEIGEGGLADIGQARSSSPTASNADDASHGARGEKKPKWVLDLGISMARNNRDAHSRYIQLATVGFGSDDSSVIKPFVRTVVFRGFYNGMDPQDKVSRVNEFFLILSRCFSVVNFLYARAIYGWADKPPIPY